MAENALDKFLAEKRQEQTINEIVNNTREKTIASLAGSINATSVDLAQRLLQRGVKPTNVEMEYAVNKRYQEGLIKKRTVTKEVTEKITLQGWLVKHTPSLYGYDTNIDGCYTVLGANGAPFQFTYSARGEGVTSQLNGAKDFASSYVLYPTYPFYGTFETQEQIETHFSKFERERLQVFMQLFSPLAEKLL